MDVNVASNAAVVRKHVVKEIGHAVVENAVMVRMMLKKKNEFVYYKYIFNIIVIKNLYFKN